MTDSPGLAPDQRVQHGGQSPQGQADVGRQGGQQSPLAVVRTKVQSRLTDSTEEKEPPDKRLKWFLVFPQECELLHYLEMKADGLSVSAHLGHRWR